MSLGRLWFISLCLHTSQAYFPTRKVRKLLSRENGVWVGQVNIKNFEYVLNFSPLSSLRRLKQPLDPSAFCGVKCAQAGMERDRSGVVENTVPFDIWKFRKVKPEILVEWNAPLIPPFRSERKRRGLPLDSERIFQKITVPFDSQPKFPGFFLPKEYS